MTTKRLAKSMIDWAAFAERIPPKQIDYFRAFKSRSDMFVSRVLRNPDKLPTIDFELCKSRISDKALVAEFEKSYKALSVPYPKDKVNMKAEVEKEEKEALMESQKTIAEAQKVINDAKLMLSKIDTIPKLEEMSYEMFADYFPDQALNPWERPSFWPHNKSYQPENDPRTIY